MSNESLLSWLLLVYCLGNGVTALWFYWMLNRPYKPKRKPADEVKP